MLPMFDGLRTVTVLSVLLRLFLAAFCGGCIGLEREYKRRSAGFRTHILICLGAAMTTMTSQFMSAELGLQTDLGRLGAQVVAGIGFIGAGTIIVTRRSQVKGLTTAAGLWVAAIVGLMAGAGYYEGAILASAVVLLAELLFVRLEYRVISRNAHVTLYVEYQDENTLEELLRFYRSRGVGLVNMEISKAASGHGSSCAIFDLQLPRSISEEEVTAETSAVAGVLAAQALA